MFLSISIRSASVSISRNSCRLILSSASTLLSGIYYKCTDYLIFFSKANVFLVLFFASRFLQSPLPFPFARNHPDLEMPVEAGDLMAAFDVIPQGMVFLALEKGNRL